MLVEQTHSSGTLFGVVQRFGLRLQAGDCTKLCQGLISLLQRCQYTLTVHTATTSTGCLYNGHKPLDTNAPEV